MAQTLHYICNKIVNILYIIYNYIIAHRTLFTLTCHYKLVYILKYQASRVSILSNNNSYLNILKN